MQILFIVGSRIQIHREQVLRRHTGARGVKLQLADGDARAVGTQMLNGFQTLNTDLVALQNSQNQNFSQIESDDANILDSLK